MSVTLNVSDFDHVILYDDDNEYETSDEKIKVSDLDEDGDMLVTLELKLLREGEYTCSNVKISFDGLLDIVVAHNDRKYKIYEYIHEGRDILELCMEEIK